MSKILYVRYRNRLPLGVKKKVEQCCTEINPDNISANPTLSFKNVNTIYGISNPLSVIKTEGNDVLLGQTFDNTKSWKKVNKDYPDGNYAIFRADEDTVEVVTDAVGTRTIWYYKDSNVFICGTSQRAIIKFLSNFQFDRRVIPWIISTGSLGPYYSWDKRIKKVPIATSLRINIEEWKLTTSLVSYEINFKVSTSSGENLKQNIYRIFQQLNLNLEKWVLSLSGGYDSRIILLLLNKYKKDNKKLKTVSWGTKNSPFKKGTDAFIAKKLAKIYQTNHTFFSTSLSEEPIEKLISRFLKNGEGRIDHISSYMNGFDIWKRLFESGSEGTLRGNQIFSNLKPVSEFDVRRFMGLAIISDYSNLRKYPFLKEFEQVVPTELKQRERENLHQYRDRILKDYRIPVIQAALSDLKFPYIEQFDLLLSYSIIEEIKKLPDESKNEKKLMKEMFVDLDNQLEFATKSATKGKEKLFRKKEMINVIIDELDSKQARDIFPANFLSDVIGALLQKSQKSASSSLIGIIKKFILDKIPLEMKKKIYKKLNTSTLDTFILGFRLMLISKMNRILIEDANVEQ